MSKDTKFTKETKKVLWIGVSIIAALFTYIIGTHSSFEDDLEALKPVARESRVSLSMFKEMQEGLRVPIKEEINYDDKLVFELSSNLPIYVSLIVKSDNGEIEVILKSARIPPGKDKSLDRYGKPFIYHVPEKYKKFEFCIVYASNAENLGKIIRQVSNDWPHLPDSQCVAVHVVA